MAFRIDAQTERKLADYCSENGISRLSLFGSVLKGEDRPDSDIDLLIEFKRGHEVGLLGLAEIQDRLSELLARKVDLRTPMELSRYFRDEVVSSAEELYAA